MALEAGTGTQALDRAVSILELLRAASSPLRLQEIAGRLDLRPATAHRLLQALVRHGFVQQYPETRAYWLGWGLVDLANVLINNTEFGTQATELVKGLRDLTGETAAIQLRVGLDRVCVMEFESPHDLRRSLGVGRRIPLHSGASGRVILAFLPSDELAVLLRDSPPRPTVNYDVLELPKTFALLDEIRRRGYARSEPKEERVAGVAALSTPFFRANGEVYGALSISGPSGRWTREVMERYVPALLQAGQALSNRLGARERRPWYQPDER